MSVQSDLTPGAVNAARDGRGRVVIESVTPQVDAGRYPIKRVIGQQVVVAADVFTDGHDAVRCRVRYWRRESSRLAYDRNDGAGK